MAPPAPTTPTDSAAMSTTANAWARTAAGKAPLPNTAAALWRMASSI